MSKTQRVDFAQPIHDNLRRLLARRKMSARAFAIAVAERAPDLASPSTVGEWLREGGAQRITAAAIPVFCKVLGTTPTTLLRGANAGD